VQSVDVCRVDGAGEMRMMHRAPPVLLGACLPPADWLTLG
jgi:hypothetical protein